MYSIIQAYIICERTICYTLCLDKAVETLNHIRNNWSYPCLFTEDEQLIIMTYMTLTNGKVL